MAKVRWDVLFSAAEHARNRAYAPYSNFHVGAALWLDDDTIIFGCNVENASYGLTICAERNALGQAVAAHRRVKAVAIVVDSKKPTPPCGMCRQVMLELCAPDVPVRTRTLKGATLSSTVARLLPHAFVKQHLFGAAALAKAARRRPRSPR